MSDISKEARGRSNDSALADSAEAVVFKDDMKVRRSHKLARRLVVRPVDQSKPLAMLALKSSRSLFLAHDSESDQGQYGPLSIV